MNPEIENLSRKIEEQAQKTRVKAEEIRSQDELTIKVNEEPYTGKVTGVDGGLVKKDLHGLQVIITRACAVQMNYREGKLQEHSYFPGPSPVPTIYSAEEERRTKKASLYRAKTEIETAINSIKEGNPDMLILDGSIVPSPSDKPGEEADESEKELYQELIDRYSQLFTESLEKGVQLIGAVEDSKSRKISKEHGEDTLDTVLLNYVLKENERTTKFNYSDEPGNHPVLSDFSPEKRNKVKAMYLKPVEQDNPLRIEYLENHMEPGEIAETLNHLSKISRNYSYPAPIIEADLHAKITREEAESVVDEIKTHTGEETLLMERRRDKRPFK